MIGKIKKEWIIIGAVIVLAISLVAGVIALITGSSEPDGPDSETTSGSHLEANGQTAGEETVAAGAAEETTVPDTTEETTDSTKPSDSGTPGTTTPSGEAVDTDSTTPPQSSSGQGNAEQGSVGQDSSSGTGFEDSPQSGPETAVTTPPVTTAPPEETEPIPTETMAPDKPVEEYTYKEYMNLSSSEKTAFFYKFPSLGAFNRWYNAAKAAADDEKLVIGNNSIDLNELLETTEP